MIIRKLITSGIGNRLIRLVILGSLAGLIVLLASPSAWGLENLLIAQADSGNTETQADLEGESLSIALPVLTLLDALTLSLENNRGIESKMLDLENAYAQERSNMVDFLPGFSTMYSYTRYGSSSTIETPDFSFTLQPEQSTRWSLMFSYPLYSGGRESAIRRAGDAGIRAAEYDLKVEQAYETLDVIQAYMNVLEAEAALEAMRKSLAHLDEVSRMAQASFDAGLIPLNNLLSAQVARSQIAQAVNAMVNNIELAKSALAILVTGDITDRWTLVEVEYPETEIPYSLEILWEWALANRPSLKSLDAGREALAAQLEVLKSLDNPTVSFDAEYSRSGEDLIPNSGSISGSINIFWSFYDFGGTDDRAAPLEGQLEQLDLQREALETMIQQQVEQALLFVRTQLGNLEVSREALVQAEEAARVARRRQEEGLGLMIEVLSAESTLAQLEVNYIQIQYDYYAGLAGLSRTVGMPTSDLLALIMAAKEAE